MHIALFEFYSETPTPDYEQIAAELRLRGHIVWSGAPNQDGDLEWHDGDRVIDVQRGPRHLSGRLLRVPVMGTVLRRIVFFGFLMRVRRFLRQSQPDIVQVNRASVVLIWLLPLLMPRRLHFVIDFRQLGDPGATDFAGRLRGLLRATLANLSARFTFHHSCFLHPAGARKILGEQWEKWASIVPLGVAPRFLGNPKENGRTFRSRKRVRFLYLGRLSRVRRLEVILHAARTVMNKTTAFELLLLGPDICGGFYHNLVDALELNSTVAIRPPVHYEAVPDVALSHDVAMAYVPDLPDWRYHPTLKVLEYRALGMPIIATDNLPNREIVDQGVNGLLVGSSVESLAEGMLRFVTDREFLRNCQLNARRMRRGTTWKQVAEMYEQRIYLPLISRGAFPSTQTH